MIHRLAECFTTVCNPACGVLAASLVPLAMVAAGISGLVVASVMPGSPINWFAKRVSFFPPKIPSFGPKAAFGRFGPPAGFKQVIRVLAVLAYLNS
jgi:hypothetical protein